MNQDDEGKHMPRSESHCGFRLWSADYLDFRRSSMSPQGSVALPLWRPGRRCLCRHEVKYVWTRILCFVYRCDDTIMLWCHCWSFCPPAELQSSLGEQLSASLKFVFTGQNNFFSLVTIIIKTDELYNLVFFAPKLLCSLPASSLQCHMTKFLCAG